MIAIVDYGVGNLYSLSSSLTYIGLDNVITGDADVIRRADRVILPGVGAFEDARKKLDEAGLTAVVKQEALKKPLLGICLGMQMLFDKSLEFGEHEGLGLIPGIVSPLKDDLKIPELKVPHIGWNRMDILKNDPLFKYVKKDEYVYYVHSFYAKTDDEYILSTSDYSIPVTGTVRNGFVYGTQFHPEKSGDTGLRLLKAFGEL